MKRAPTSRSQAGITNTGIAWCILPWGKTNYVGQVQGDGGKDWGWTSDVDKALPLSPYWQHRYLADRRACGIPIRRVQS